MEKYRASVATVLYDDGTQQDLEVWVLDPIVIGIGPTFLSGAVKAKISCVPYGSDMCQCGQPFVRSLCKIGRFGELRTIASDI